MQTGTADWIPPERNAGSMIVALQVHVLRLNTEGKMFKNVINTHRAPRIKRPFFSTLSRTQQDYRSLRLPFDNEFQTFTVSINSQPPKSQ